MIADDVWSAFPGADLVRKGLEDAARGIESAESLLIAIGRPRLARLGFALPPTATREMRAEHRLYELLARDDPRGAHSRYNALIRRLVSFEHAAEGAVARASRGAHRM